MRFTTPLCAAAAFVVACGAAEARPHGIVTSTAGRDVVAFDVTDPAGAPSVAVAGEQPDGSFTVFARTPAERHGYAVALGGGDEVVGAYETHTEDGRGGVFSTGGAVFAGGPAFGPVRRVIAPQSSPVGVRLAANRRGDGAVLAAGGALPYVLMRRAGGRFRRPLAPIAGFRPSVLAVDGDGRAVVAGGDDAGGLHVTTVQPDGRVGEPQTLSRDASSSTATRAAAAAGGRAALLWTGADHVLRFAARASAGAPFGAPVALSAGRPYGITPLALHLDAAGRAVAVWAQHDDETGLYRLRAAAIAADGRPGEPMWLSAPDWSLFYPVAAAAGNERGDVVVTWRENRPPAPGEGAGWRPRPRQVARLMTTSGETSPPAVLSAEGRRPESASFVSVSPAGRASVLWTDAPAESDYAGDERVLLTRLDAAGATPPLPMAPGGPLPATAVTLRPTLQDARVDQRTARVDRAGRLRLGVGCRSWSLEPCAATVRLRRRGRVVARGKAVAGPAGAPVRLRLTRPARRRLARSGRLRVVAVVSTGGAEGGTRARTLVLTRRSR